MTALTARLLESMYGPGFPALAVPEEDAVPVSMAPEAVAQSWYRMLHTIGTRRGGGRGGRMEKEPGGQVGRVVCSCDW